MAFDGPVTSLVARTDDIGRPAGTPGCRAPRRGGPRSAGYARAIAALAISALLGACGGGAAPDAALPAPDPARLFFSPELGVDLADFERSPSGLYVQDVEEGDGPVARRDSRVWVRYVGWLADGTVFDGSVGGSPFHFRLGGSEVIRGWNEGIVGMRRGGTRRLVVPPSLAYGSRGRGDVPPGATLVFLVELVDVG